MSSSRGRTPAFERVVRHSRTLWLAAIALVSVPLVLASATDAQNKFKLKPGAAGKICFDCHGEFQDKLKATFVHTPVKTGECAGCHSPHTSKHGKLLSASPSAICTTCHADIVPAKAISSHKVAIEGNCARCHDPHASENKGLLRKAGNELCLGCHKAVGDLVAKVKFKHVPVSNDCLSCHNAHGSDKAGHLLTKAVPGLCVECHKPDNPNFVRQHANYPVAKADCSSCHDPHGSNTAGILYDTVHAPVASKRCTQCHNAATAAEPFATRRAGFELCRGCHSTMVNDAKGCLNCHEAHASRQKKLLNVAEATLCGQCHADTMDYQARLTEKAKQEKAGKVRGEKGTFTHSPVVGGDCSTCHAPHASDSARLMRQASTVEGCGACHDWLKHTSHPMGEKVTDLRNKNRSVDCLSCHRSHGTGYRYLIPFPTPTDLCVQCHKQLRR
jgi:predicted CXXCH cytochrome family protein